MDEVHLIFKVPVTATLVRKPHRGFTVNRVRVADEMGDDYTEAVIEAIHGWVLGGPFTVTPERLGGTLAEGMAAIRMVAPGDSTRIHQLVRDAIAAADDSEWPAWEFG